MKLFLISALLLFTSALIPAQAQEKSWSASVDLEHASSYPKIVGKGKAGYYSATIHERRKTYLSIFHYDHSLNFRQKRQMELPPKAELLNLGLITNRIMVTYLETNGKQSTLIATVFDHDLEPVKMHTELKTFALKKPSYLTKAKDSSLHLVLHEPKSENFHHLALSSNLSVPVHNQLKVEQKGGKWEMEEMAVINSSLALALQSDKKGMYCLIHDARNNDHKFHRLSNNDKFVSDALLEVDQLQEAYVLNGLYKSNRKAKDFKGVSFHVFDGDSRKKQQYQAFPKDYIQMFYGKTTKREGLANLVPRSLIPRSDGGTVFMFEEVDSETQIYRDYNYYGFKRSTSRETYYHDNIGILALSNEGKLEWEKIHRKNQITTATQQLHASFSTHVTKRAIIFLYNRNSGNDEDLLSYATKPSGNITGDLLLKSSESNADPIAREARQVAHNEVIVPSYIDREKLVLLRLRF